jgi:hypothetical protein
LATKKFLRKLINNPRFLELGIHPDEVKRMIKGQGRIPYEHLISSIYDRYGQRQGKSIVGDKTPGYARELPTIHRLWPTARFVHLIRDGRDVCLSILNWERAKRWGAGEGAARFRSWTGDPVGTAALWWEWHVRLAREAGRQLGSGLYYEVRYESLVARPRDECRALCAFLGVPHDDVMIQAYQERVLSSPGRNQKHPWMPITPGLRDWQTQMSPEALKSFEMAAGGLLQELGYCRAAPPPQPLDTEYAALVRDCFARDAHAHRYSVPRTW